MSLNMRDLFGRAFAGTAGDLPAVVTPGATLTYAELHDAALRLVSWFDSVGVVPGSPVAIMVPNGPAYVVTDIAIALAGAAKVPLNDLMSDDDIAFIVDDARPVVCVADSRRASLLARGSTGHRVDSVVIVGSGADDGGTGSAVRWEDALSFPPTSPAELAARDIPEDAPGLLIYTGGTTGRSKGVVHTQRGLVVNLLVHRIETELTATDRLLLSSPLPHSAGFLLQTALLAGAVSHIRGRFNPEETLDLIASEEITYLFLVPTMLYRLLDAKGSDSVDTSSVRTILYGAAPMSVPRLREGRERFGEVFLQLYAQSEAPNFLTRLSKTDHHPENGRLGSCGRACATVEISIVDPETGAILGPGEVGEVVARTEFTMTGYLGLPEVTAATLEDGRLHTGDVGYLDASGYLYIVDRLKDMVISGGMNVYTTEVERVLLTLPGVGEAAVIGLPDADWGELVCAVVVPNGDTFSDADADAHCRARLSAYKRPKRYATVDRLPLTNYGKVDKRQLVAALSASG